MPSSYHYMPKVDFSSCEQVLSDNGFTDASTCQNQCINMRNTCVSRIQSTCEKGCPSICTTECANSGTDPSPSKRATQVQYCMDTCAQQCAADCPSFLKSKCDTESCTIPICNKLCANPSDTYNLYEYPLLNHPSDSCQVGEFLNTYCLDFDTNKKQWIYNTSNNNSMTINLATSSSTKYHINSFRNSPLHAR